MTNTTTMDEHPAIRALLARMGPLDAFDELCVDHLRKLLRETAAFIAANDSPVVDAIMAVVNDDTMNGDALKGWCAGIFTFAQSQSLSDPFQSDLISSQPDRR